MAQLVKTGRKGLISSLVVKVVGVKEHCARRQISRREGSGDSLFMPLWVDNTGSLERSYEPNK